jgi:diguanylate cyclase (GGDEF)-like protein
MCEVMSLKNVIKFCQRLLMPQAEEFYPRFSATYYARQRRSGFPALKFDPELEAEYLESFVAINVSRIRVASLSAITLIMLFVIMDRGFGQHLQPPSSEFMLVISGLSLVIPFFCTFLHNRQHLPELMLVCTWILALTMVAVLWFGRAARPDFPYEPLLLVTMYVYFLAGLPWGRAVFCGLGMWLAFIGSHLLSPGSAPLLMYEIFYLLGANVIGVIGRYIFEHQDRLAFLMQRELSYLAQHDSLTRLLNRRAFRVRAELAWAQAQRECRPVGLLILDVDHFKAINDLHGHFAGDSVLREIALLLKNLVKRPLDAAGRFGGDEFVAVWYDVDRVWFEALQTRLMASIAALEYEVPGLKDVKVSGGAVLAWPNFALTLQGALREADSNLYQVKQQARSQIRYTQLGAPQLDDESLMTGS